MENENLVIARGLVSKPLYFGFCTQRPTEDSHQDAFEVTTPGYQRLKVTRWSIWRGSVDHVRVYLRAPCALPSHQGPYMTVGTAPEGPTPMLMWREHTPTAGELDFEMNFDGVEVANCCIQHVCSSHSDEVLRWGEVPQVSPGPFPGLAWRKIGEDHGLWGGDYLLGRIVPMASMEAMVLVATNLPERFTLLPDHYRVNVLGVVFPHAGRAPYRGMTWRSTT